MANFPSDPVAGITRSGTPNPNTDLPPGAFPAVKRILVTDLVGPKAANRQVAQLEKQTNDLLSSLSSVITLVDLFDGDVANAMTTLGFLRRDGTAAKDGKQGMLGILLMNLHKITKLLDGTLPPLVKSWSAGQCSKNTLSITRSAGPVFASTDVGSWFLWGDQVLDKIATYVSPNTVTVESSQASSSTAGGVYASSKDAVNADQLFEVLCKITPFDPIGLLPRSGIYGTRPMLGDLLMADETIVDTGNANYAHNIRRVAPGSSGYHAVNKNQLDAEATARAAADAAELARALAEEAKAFHKNGDVQATGNWNLGGFYISNSASAPTIFTTTPGPDGTKIATSDESGNWADTVLCNRVTVRNAVQDYCPRNNYLGQYTFIKQDGDTSIDRDDGENPADYTTYYQEPHLKFTLDAESLWEYQYYILFRHRMSLKVTFSGTTYFVMQHIQHYNHGGGNEALGPRAWSSASGTDSLARETTTKYTTPIFGDHREDDGTIGRSCCVIKGTIRNGTGGDLALEWIAKKPWIHLRTDTTLYNGSYLKVNRIRR